MEATPEQTAEGMVIVQVLAAVLDRLVNANTSLALTDPGQVTKFHALKAPGIGIQQYLERIQKYSSCSNECFVLALIYIDRLIQRNNFLLTELNVHRVVITAILLAAKFFDDAYYNNAYYAKVGGVLVAEMNGLEVDFLFRINFSLHVTPELFHKYKEELMSQSTNGATSAVAVTPIPSVPIPPQPEIPSITSSVPTTVAGHSLISVANTVSDLHRHHHSATAHHHHRQHPILTQHEFAAVTEERANYITPSPPASTRNPVMPASDLMVPVPIHSRVSSTSSSAATEQQHQQLHPYLQRAQSTLPVPTFPNAVPSHGFRRCASQTQYSGMSLDFSEAGLFANAHVTAATPMDTRPAAGGYAFAPAPMSTTATLIHYNHSKSPATDFLTQNLSSASAGASGGVSTTDTSFLTAMDTQYFVTSGAAHHILGS
uniref:Cyclin n=1 Tax=Grammatophora oceanica TaxID=210454 RepID=A0A7S1VVV1_9STRA|mmetsp:Transcript_9736/g.14341  ORF Transcript_9736/g.14341 Transcript_9736/m.14341 type:complete len:430 (+) Transcript_9736:351-1640(+)|eukprot:CAMPEP_0194060758 /NCGR_PEP_ID=MMETSP0009_2-20130614/72654_1 /TAXON_ID=210454 /ORGANISM="Grammatophora oceanica, Strain CCMP 410" /LENGTH=429 /DNA_ID=CAMNT_0038711779 /DNA_START=329 /DNA_END=1618 /DNA_ORIENTATION=+